jgi:hypothetical protein
VGAIRAVDVDRIGLPLSQKRTRHTPIYHQLEHRADAHILIALLACCLPVTLKHRILLHAPGLTRMALAGEVGRNPCPLPKAGAGNARRSGRSRSGTCSLANHDPNESRPLRSTLPLVMPDAPNPTASTIPPSDTPPPSLSPNTCALSRQLNRRAHRAKNTIMALVPGACPRSTECVRPAPRARYTPPPRHVVKIRRDSPQRHRLPAPFR